MSIRNPQAVRRLARWSVVFLCTGLIAAASSGAARAGGGDTTTTDETAFLNSLQPGYYFESFDELTQAYYPEPLLFSDGTPGGFAYSTTTDTGGGIYVAPPDETLPSDLAISPADAAAMTLVFTFSGEPVTAVGGEFFTTDVSGLAEPGTVTLTLSDGSTYTITSGSSTLQAFFGVASPTPISWASVTEDSGSGAYPTVNNLIVGDETTPEPGTLALAGIAGMLVAIRQARPIRARASRS
jgi:hypothetical protein